MTLIPPTRRLGWLLSIYGVVGIVAAIAVLVGSIVVGYQVSRLRDAVATQRQAIISTLDSTILLLGTVTTASGNIQIALDNTSATLDQAQGLAKSAADASNAVAGFAGFTIFGQQPLAGVADAFGNVAEQSAQVADQIGKIGTSLSDLSGDLQAAVPALEKIQDQAQAAKDDLAGADRLDDLPTFIGIGIVLVGIYLAWLGMTALGSLWLGRRMLAMTRTPVAGAAAPAVANVDAHASPAFAPAPAPVVPAPAPEAAPVVPPAPAPAAAAAPAPMAPAPVAPVVPPAPAPDAEPPQVPPAAPSA
ncbi:MAG: hypothetical protein MUE82_05380 [Chloroflexi bacterium]|nr:hypothetical protein [Chloroflexota bacterium]